MLSSIFQGIPECIGLVTLCYALLKIAPEWAKIVKVGILLGVITYFVRMLPIIPGVHTLILILILTLLLRRAIALPLSRLFITVLLSALLLVLAEFCFARIEFSILHQGYEELVKRPVIWTLAGIPHVAFLFAVAWLIYRRNRGFFEDESEA